MGKILFRIFSYISHYIKRKDEHSLHSPFLFDFYCNTVKARHLFKINKAEQYRSELLNNTSPINVKESGAFRLGHKNTLVKKRAKKSLSPVSQSAFLGAVTYFIQPDHILEIGTSFGVSACYFAHYAPAGTICTLEGNEGIAEMARSAFSKLHYTNVQVKTGEFGSTLDKAVQNAPQLDLVFFDGNHRYQPTLNYFYTCLLKAGEKSVFIFHDIYWSEEMYKAWLHIKEHESVTLSLDLFCFGIVFFRKNQPKQHFVLKF